VITLAGIVVIISGREKDECSSFDHHKNEDAELNALNN
jgi:hypothetical protein